MGSREKVVLPIKRFRQRTGECSLAAIASFCNFYDEETTYRSLRKWYGLKWARGKKFKGLESYEYCELLNELGYVKVKVVTADLDVMDFSWNRLKRRTIIRRMRERAEHWRRVGDVDSTDEMLSWANWLGQKDCDNKIVVDVDFHKQIKRTLRDGHPLLASVNWTALFSYRKWPDNSWIPKIRGDVFGEPDYHLFVIRGFDNKGVYIIDSHWQYYNGSRSKYSSGRYRLSWERYLMSVQRGDLIMVG